MYTGVEGLIVIVGEEWRYGMHAHSILDSSILRAKSSRQGMAPQKVYSSTTHATRCADQ